jgi:hypothetical protein
MKRLVLVAGLLALAGCGEPKTEVTVSAHSPDDPRVSREMTVEVTPEQARAIEAQMKKPSEPVPATK